MWKGAGKGRWAIRERRGQWVRLEIMVYLKVKIVVLKGVSHEIFRALI
jgi:hypothetical protein